MKIVGRKCYESRENISRTFTKKLRELNVTKIQKSKCRGNLKLRTTGREEKPI